MRPLIACLLFAFSTFAAAADKPNIVMISIDDMNDWLGCLGGHPQAQTPHIDSLADRGVLFSNAHCQAPICTPSRNSMLLGKLPTTTGHYFLAPRFRDVEITKDAETLFQTFRKNGYYASTAGKVFHGSADPASFDDIENPGGWRRPKEKMHYTVPGSHKAWDWGEITDVPDEEQLDYRSAAWAAEEIPRRAAEEQPFVVAVGFHLPHVPVYASKKWFDLYPLETLKLPEALKNDRDDLPEIAKQLTANPTAPPHQWMVDHHEDIQLVRAYLASISFVDHLVGMVIDSLDASGVADNTIVVLFSDHGFHLGEKQRWAKRTLWEDGTHVPLILAGPGITKGKPCTNPVGLIDVYPTLLELTGLPPRNDLDGHSLVPLLQDPAAYWPYPAITTFGPGNHAIRSNSYRYIHYADGSEELYRHPEDKNEWNNLASNPEYESVMAEHRKFLPENDAEPVPGSSGSDSPLYGESNGLQNRKPKKDQKPKD